MPDNERRRDTGDHGTRIALLEQSMSVIEQ